MATGGGNFPTIGLRFDMEGVLALFRAKPQVVDAYRDMAKASEDAATAAAASSKKQKKAADDTAVSTKEAAKALREQMKAMREQGGAIDAHVAKLNLLLKVQKAVAAEEKVRKTAERMGGADLTEAIGQTQRLMAFRQRMAAQRVAEERQAQVAEKAGFEAAINNVQALMAFRQRMTRQRIGEEQAAAAAIAEAYRRAEASARREGRQYSVISTGKVVNAPDLKAGPQGIGGLVAAMLGFGRAAEDGSRRGGGFISMLQRLGQATRSIRLTMLDARFAIAAFMAAITLGPLAGMADQMTGLEARTRLYAERASDVPFLLEKTYQTAQRARAPLEGVAQLYTRLAPLGQQLGRSQSQLLDVVETVSKAFAIGGASASEATASAQQFAQALSSNRFGGDELRSVAENAPILLKALAEGVNQLSKEGFPGLDKALNLNAATFIKWAQGGHANASIMVAALERVKTKIDDAFKTMPVTISQGFTVLKNAATQAIGEIDKLASTNGTRLSTQIAEKLAALGRFLESREFIEGAATALRGLVTIIEKVAEAVSFLANNWKILTAAIGGFLAARTIISVFTFLTSTIGGTTGAVYALATGMNVLRGAWLALTGPLGLITAGILAATGAFLAYSSVQQTLAASTDKMLESQERGSQGMVQAIAYAEKYGDSTKNLLTNLTSMSTTQDAAAQGALYSADANNTAARAAQLRAEAERAAAAAIFTRLSAEARGEAQKVGKAMNSLAGPRNALAQVETMLQSRAMPAAERRRQEARRAQLQAQVDQVQGNQMQLELDAARYGSLAEDIKTSKPVATVPANGTGVSLAGANKADKSGQSLEKRLERLDAEIEKSRAAKEAIDAETAARTRLAKVEDAFYSGGLTDLNAYAAGLTAYRDAQLAARLAEDKRRILAQQDAKQLGDLKGAELERTETLIAASAAEIKASDTADRLADSREALGEITKQIGATKAYTQAILEGEDALRKFELRQRAGEIVAQGKGAVSPAAAEQAALDERMAAANKFFAERAKQREQDLRLAQMSTAEADRENRALEIAKQLQDQLNLATYQEALARARNIAALEQQQDRMAELARDMKDSFERAFVETGKLDFKGLKQGATRALRQAIYDALIAKPINIVVNAVVNVLTQGLQNLLGNLLGGQGGGGLLGGLGELLGGGSGFDKLLGAGAQDLTGGLRGLKDAAGSLAESTQKFSTGLMGKLSGGMSLVGTGVASAFLGSSVAKMLGIGDGSKESKIGGLVGGAAGGIGGAMLIGGTIAGPIGAVVGAILGTLVGGLFGKPTNAGAGVAIRNNSSLGEITGKSRTEETTQAATAAAQAIIAGVQAMEQIGIDATKEITGLVLGGRDKTQIYTSSGETLYGKVGDAADAANVGLMNLLQSANYASDAQKNLAMSMAAAGDGFDAIIVKLQKLAEAEAFVKGIDREILKYTNPQEYALANLRDSQISRRKQALGYFKDGLIDQTTLASLNEKFAQLERLEIVDALSQFQTAVTAAGVSVEEFADKQKRIAEYLDGLKVGALSPLNPEAQLSEAGQQFMRTINAARGGDMDAYDKATGMADTYLEKAKSFYGATAAYNTIFQTVTSALEQLQAMAYPGQTAGGEVTADGAAVEAAVQALQAEITKANAELLAAVDPVANDNATSADIQQQTDVLAPLLQNIADTFGLSTEAIVAAIAANGGVFPTTDYQSLVNGGVLYY